MQSITHTHTLTHTHTHTNRTPLLSKASLAECIQNPFTANHDNGFHGPSKLVSNPNPVQPSLIMEQAYRSPNFGGIYPHSSQPDFQYQYYKDFNSDPAAYEGFQVGAVQLAPQEDGQQNSIIRQPTQTFSHQVNGLSVSLLYSVLKVVHYDIYFMCVLLIVRYSKVSFITSCIILTSFKYV